MESSIKGSKEKVKPWMYAFDVRSRRETTLLVKQIAARVHLGTSQTCDNEHSYVKVADWTGSNRRSAVTSVDRFRVSDFTQVKF